MTRASPPRIGYADPTPTQGGSGKQRLHLRFRADLIHGAACLHLIKALGSRTGRLKSAPSFRVASGGTRG